MMRAFRERSTRSSRRGLRPLRGRFLVLVDITRSADRPTAGGLTVRFAHRPQASFHVQYEMDHGERLLIERIE